MWIMVLLMLSIIGCSSTPLVWTPLNTMVATGERHPVMLASEGWLAVEFFKDPLVCSVLVEKVGCQLCSSSDGLRCQNVLPVISYCDESKKKLRMESQLLLKKGAYVFNIIKDLETYAKITVEYKNPNYALGLMGKPEMASLSEPVNAMDLDPSAGIQSLWYRVPEPLSFSMVSLFADDPFNIKGLIYHCNERQMPTHVVGAVLPSQPYLLPKGQGPFLIQIEAKKFTGKNKVQCMLRPMLQTSGIKAASLMKVVDRYDLSHQTSVLVLQNKELIPMGTELAVYTGSSLKYQRWLTVCVVIAVEHGQAHCQLENMRLPSLKDLVVKKDF